MEKKWEDGLQGRRPNPSGECTPHCENNEVFDKNS